MSFLVVAQSSWEIPEGLMNNPVCVSELVVLKLLTQTHSAVPPKTGNI